MGEANRRKAEIAKIIREGRGRSILAGGDVRLPGAAIHEAGHAAATFMTAPAMGYEPAAAVAQIEFDPPPRGPVASTHVLARTRSALFSRSIADASSEFDAQYWRPGQNGPLTLQGQDAVRDYFTGVVKLARAAGADIDAWIDSKILIGVAGSVADATAQKRSFRDVILNEPDQNIVFVPCMAAGLSADETNRRVLRSAELLQERFADPIVWNAILTLALACPFDGGTITGSECWRIYSGAIERPKIEAVPLRSEPYQFQL